VTPSAAPSIGALVWLAFVIFQWPTLMDVLPSPRVGALASSSHAPNCRKLETDVGGADVGVVVADLVSIVVVAVVDVTGGVGVETDGAPGLSFGPFGRPLPWASTFGGTTSEATRRDAIAKGRERCVMAVSP
jgi:hypothetical protein